MISLSSVRFAFGAAASGRAIDVDKNQGFSLSIDEFSVDKGERVFLHGPSGYGKSTLLSLVSGIVLPQSGKVEVLGVDISQLSHRRRDLFRAEHMGIVFQQFNLISYLSVWQNVLLGAEFSRERKARAEAVKGAGGGEKKGEGQGALEGSVGGLLSRLGLKGLEERRAQNLSVGQQQRVALARALYGKPEILLVDEPTSALDSDLKSAFMDYLVSLCDEMACTLIFVSHDSDLARYFSKRLALSDVMVSGV